MKIEFQQIQLYLSFTIRSFIESTLKRNLHPFSSHKNEKIDKQQHKRHIRSGKEHSWLPFEHSSPSLFQTLFPNPSRGLQFILVATCKFCLTGCRLVLTVGSNKIETRANERRTKDTRSCTRKCKKVPKVLSLCQQRKSPLDSLSFFPASSNE